MQSHILRNAARSEPPVNSSDTRHKPSAGRVALNRNENRPWGSSASLAPELASLSVSAGTRSSSNAESALTESDVCERRAIAVPESAHSASSVSASGSAEEISRGGYHVKTRERGAAACAAGGRIGWNVERVHGGNLLPPALAPAKHARLGTT